MLRHAQRETERHARRPVSVLILIAAGLGKQHTAVGNLVTFGLQGIARALQAHARDRQTTSEYSRIGIRTDSAACRRRRIVLRDGGLAANVARARDSIDTPPSYP
jgi:hypothetical protein